MNKPGPLNFLLAVVFAALFVCSCSKAPDGVIPPSEMASLMADIHIGESVVETERRAFPSDSSRQILKQSILARHGYDVAVFDSSLMYYGKNMDRYAELYSDVIDILEKRIAATEASAATEGASAVMASASLDLSVDGDSVDVWTLPRSILFSPASPVENIPFGLSSDRFWERGDVYKLRAKLSGSGPEGLNLFLAVEYMDGSIDHIGVRAVGDGWKSVQLISDSARVARYVYGTIAYDTDRSRPRIPAALDSISLFRTRFSPANHRDPRQRSLTAPSSSS
ncbi:MAG: DUF4296 domain-containing protein [Pseudoflavonifractor sp.]|nr:DUF4296 domain-containing protein [Alloprevotella sp.]MCM1116052.1 DUF4296 domain-containing protein [Pseudoflavonifractor sp.]